MKDHRYARSRKKYRLQADITGNNINQQLFLIYTNTQEDKDIFQHEPSLFVRYWGTPSYSGVRHNVLFHISIWYFDLTSIIYIWIAPFTFIAYPLCSPLTCKCMLMKSGKLQRLAYRCLVGCRTYLLPFFTSSPEFNC